MYGRYFGLKTACFRCGCLAGPGRHGLRARGFLSSIMESCLSGEEYTVFGHNGKQVRDLMHVWDLVNAAAHFFRRPRAGEVYNLGGGRFSNCSVLEAIKLSEDISGKKLKRRYLKHGRRAELLWYIGSAARFRSHYPGWNYQYGLKDIGGQIYEACLSGQRMTLAGEAGA